MRQESLNINYSRIEKSSDWSKIQKELIDVSYDASLSAHAPYSNFLVGAAALTSDQQIHTANNQENAAYPSGMCAERVLLFSLNAVHPDLQIHKVALVAHPREQKNTQLVSPCGACRQVFIELKDKFTEDFELILSTTDAEQGLIFNDPKDLLPFVFSVASLL